MTLSGQILLGEVVFSDGPLRIEFWEDFDDLAVADGIIEFSQLDLYLTPTPFTFALLGVGGVALVRRRR